jgi:2-oxo-4-hydroxy-4-carboxy-5-ureidoimidazoline decarboxylase
VSALATLNALDAAGAAARLLDCCGSRRWAETMTAARPFADPAALHAAAASAFDGLAPADWLEAFAAHPRIGSAASTGHQSAVAERWSGGEQAGTRDATDDDRRALARGNAAYFDRFGYSFIVCATGRSAAEMRVMLERRLGNDPESELAAAAAEQRRITALRLDKMLASTGET